MEGKQYKNFLIAKKENSNWLMVFKDGATIATVPDENVALAVIKKDMGLVEPILNEELVDYHG
jgi:hypothetical protein